MHCSRLLSISSLLLCKVNQNDLPAPDTSQAFLLPHLESRCFSLKCLPLHPRFSTSHPSFQAKLRVYQPSHQETHLNCLTAIATFSESLWNRICSVFHLTNIVWAPTMCQALCWWLENQTSLVSTPWNLWSNVETDTKQVINQKLYPVTDYKKCTAGKRRWWEI